ncbi:MAG: LamG domain-containing protein, partial [bacterium]|nr:LamG domain-containing protein [bacterium]
SNTRIGKPGDTGTEYDFDGLIDEVKIYNYALTEDEIKLDYNGGFVARFGAVSTASGTPSTPSNASSRQYCVPGSTEHCAPPVLELNLDEMRGTTTYDTSGNGNDGVFVSPATSPVWEDIGRFGTALEFDGVDDYARIEDSSSLDITGELTISAWVKKNSLVDDDTILVKGDGSGGNINYGFYTYDDEFLIEVDPGTTYYEQTTSANLVVNRWYHLAVTYNDSIDSIIF